MYQALIEARIPFEMVHDRLLDATHLSPLKTLILPNIAALSDALAAFGRTVRIGIEEMNELKDADSADILTEISRGLDKWLWFVEAHQQER